MNRCAKPFTFCDDCLIRLAIEGLSTAIALVDGRSRLTFINRAAQEIFGLSPDDLNTLVAQALKDPALLRLWREASQQTEPTMGLVRTTFPTERLLRITVGICRNPDGQIIGRALLACDVTEDRKVVLELTEELARQLLRRPRSSNGVGQVMHLLTPMEWRILHLLGRGLSNRAIARQLSISQNTLRSHLKSIYRKLDLPASRSALVAFASQFLHLLPEESLTFLGEKFPSNR